MLNLLANPYADIPALTLPKPTYEPRGVFGVHGDLRNILGILGDSLRAGSGGSPIFAPMLEQEKVSKAMENFTTNPLSAIQELSKVNPALAQKYYNDYTNFQAKKASLDAGAKRDEISALDHQSQIEGRVRDRVGAMLNTSNEKTYGALKQQALAYAKKYNIDLSDLPEAYDKDALQSWTIGSIPADKQIDNNRDKYYKEAQIALGGGRLKVQAALGEGRLGVSQQNADTNQYRATHPRPKAEGGVQRPASVTPTKKYIIENGVIKTRQADGSYK